MNQLENCQSRYRSNTWMGRTRTNGPYEFEPSKFDCISVPEDYFNLNSVDPDEMQHYAAFHLGLHCLQNYKFRGFLYTKG